METSNLTHVLAHTLSISLSRSVYTIAQRDLVFRLKPSANALIGRGDSGGIMDMKLKTFSSLNNFPMRLLNSTKNSKSDPHARMAALRGSIAFVGVALQPVDYTNKNSKDMVAVQVAGSITIQNTGPYSIRPGMKVAWDVPASVISAHNGRPSLKRPRANVRGQVRNCSESRPNSKFLLTYGRFPSSRLPRTCSRCEMLSNTSLFSLSDFLAQTIPLDEIVANSVEGLAESMVQRESDIVSQMHVAHPHVGVTADPNNTTAAILKSAYEAMKNATPGTPEAREAAVFYGQLIAAYVSEANNRVIGIALSGASPGQQFGAPPRFFLLWKGIA